MKTFHYDQLVPCAAASWADVQAPALEELGAEFGLPASDLHAEGAAYGEALVRNIKAGRARPDDLATLVQYLPEGPMLAGACAALHNAIAEGGQHG